ncbi:MAG: cysteine--tRNA ligase, partial [Parasphingorhabdus sp.]
KYLGETFDIHTGGIDHREIHHPNEIAQNQAHNCSEHSGANIWMHNNFLIDRAGKMSKSSGDFLRLQVLIDKGIHPLAYRLMCLQAHYRSELEFTWENLVAAQTRLKRMVMGVERLLEKADEQTAAIEHPALMQLRDRFDAALSEDLNSSKCLPLLEELLALKKLPAEQRLVLLTEMDSVMGLQLSSLTRKELRVRPAGAAIDESDVETKLDQRQKAKSEKDFAAADAIRDELTTKGVELMDGDPLRWEWRIEI